MLIEKFVFNILAFSLFIIIFSKLIRKNDTNYVLILVFEALGIALNFLELLIGSIFASGVSKVLMYIFAIAFPIVVIIVEYVGSNFSEILAMLWARCLLLIGDKKAAKNVLINLMEKYPDAYKSHILLAEIYEKDGGTRKAIDEYVKAIESNKRDYDSYYKIAELLNDLGKKDEAIEMLGNLLVNKPEYYNASILLGNLLCEQERFKEAVSVYQDALKYKPVDFELYYSLGIAYTRLNDFPSAKECYSKAAEINHKMYSTKYNLAQIALIEEDLQEAEKYFAECLMSEELEAKAYYQLAKIYMVKEEKDKAILFANKAIEIDESYFKIIASEKIFETIKEHLTVSVKMEEKDRKKIAQRDEDIQKYLEETVGLVKGMSENEIKNRVNQKVDEIFKQEEIKKVHEEEIVEEAKEIEDVQKEKI